MNWVILFFNHPTMSLDLVKPLAFFDLEATGVDPEKDRIIEIAILKIQPDGNEVMRTFLINPECPIPAESTAIHGITDDKVANEPTFKELAPKLYKFLMDCDLGGYNNIYYDIPLLIEEFYRAGVVFTLEGRKVVDVFKIFTKKERRDLSSAYKFYCDKTLENAHTAEADIRATYDVLLGQLNRYDDVEGNMDFLDSFSNDSNFVDTGRRMIYVEGEEVFNFGKFKGKKVREVFKTETGYYDWMMRSDFGRDTKAKLKAIRETMK